MATVGGPSSVNSTIANYNRDNNKYSVVIKDYSENGTYDISTAITRLNTDIISGKHSDLLLFSGLLSVIDEEAAKYFATDKSAKKTAEAIQSRVQLYMDEQFS